MRTTTKLKKILEKNTAGFSFSEEWEMTVINITTNKRQQFSGSTFSDVIGKAYRVTFKKNKRVV